MFKRPIKVKVAPLENRAMRRLSRESIERAWSALRSMPRSSSYPVLGLAFALVAPVGLLSVRAIAAGQLPTLAWVSTELRRLPLTYAYVTWSTLAVFAFLGYVLGRWFDHVCLLSITDPLTGLFNRRHFGQRFTEEIRRSRRHGHTTCALCIDIDRLKAINDLFGHKAGDNAIIVVCRLLLNNVRAIDVVARVGGDEFAVLLPETSVAEASALSQRILAQVARHSDIPSGKLAVSIGIAQLDATADLASDDLLAAADAALYRAKAAGGGYAAIARPMLAAWRNRHTTQINAALLIKDGESDWSVELNHGFSLRHGPKAAIEVCRECLMKHDNSPIGDARGQLSLQASRVPQARVSAANVNSFSMRNLQSVQNRRIVSWQGEPEARPVPRSVRL